MLQLLTEPKLRVWNFRSLIPHTILVFIQNYCKYEQSDLCSWKKVKINLERFQKLDSISDWDIWR